jgi:hypothetical protein
MPKEGAISPSQPTLLVSAGELAPIFKNAHVEPSDLLDLSTSLRSHLAADVHQWVALLLKGELATTNAIATAMKDVGFDLYVTRVVS